jgi:hypothetical protein
MKKKSLRKLHICRETLRDLDKLREGEIDSPAKLKEVVGGRPVPTGYYASCWEC